MGECPLCGESTNKPSTRLINEACGHSKCRLCLLNEESGCSICEGNNGDISRTFESIGNFDYRLPATTIPNYEELHSTPRKLDYNKISHDFADCSLDGEKLIIDNSINQSLENIVGKIRGPEMVDIGTETESFVNENDIQSKIIQENSHLACSQVTQTPTQPVTKLPEVFANTVGNNHLPHQETSVVQNTNFIPLTQRSDGRQFITIAFIANNSPNKNQQVVAPLLNQCLPAIANMTAAQRPGGNQCIPMIGNVNALTNGNQFIIRNPNIVQNLVGNQSMPIIGSLNTIQNLTGNQPLSVVGNVNAVKNVVGNQSLPAAATVNALHSPIKGQCFSTTGSSNIVHKVVEDHPCQVAQTVPKQVENPSAPMQENVNIPRKQTRTRGLPRIKTVKNVNIVQKSATNQSDKINSQIEKSPVKGKRQRRKELPVYLIPRKPNEQTKSVPAKSPAHPISCMSPEYKLEDYLLFNKQQQISDAATKGSQIQTELINDTQMINQPSETVINKTPVVSDQFNCTIMDKKLKENKVTGFQQESQISNDDINNEKSMKDVIMETNNCKNRQDLSVVFNIREENKQTLAEKVDEKESTIKVSNGETSNKDEYQNLDVLFDIIEKESNKLNGGIFDKAVKPDLNEENSFKYEANQKVQEKIDNVKDTNNVLEQKVSYCKEKNSIEKHPFENGSMPLLDETDESSTNEKHCILNTEMELVKEKRETLNNRKECQNQKEENLGSIMNNPFVNYDVGNNAQFQSLNKIDDGKKDCKTANKEHLQKQENQYFSEKIFGKQDNSFHEYRVNNDNDSSPRANENSDVTRKHHHSFYEDISDEENDSEEINNENLESSISSEEDNDEMDSFEYLNETIVEEEDNISDDKEAHQDSGRQQSLSTETHKEENVKLPLTVDKDLPILHTNDSVNHEVHVICQNEQSSLVQKSRGRPKKSLDNYEVLHENEQLMEVEKQTDTFKSLSSSFEQNDEREQETELLARFSNLCVENDRKRITIPQVTDGINDRTRGENVNGNDRNGSLTLRTQDDINERSVNDDSDAATVIKKIKGRNSKLLSNCSLRDKPVISGKIQRVVVKKPRGRPKKSIFNFKQSSKELPSLNRENNYDEDQDQRLDEKFDGTEIRVLDGNVRIHNGEKEENMNFKLNMHDRDKNADPARENKQTIVVKKPRGRPKNKNVLLNVNQQIKSQMSIDNERLLVGKPSGDSDKALLRTDEAFGKAEIINSSVNIVTDDGDEDNLYLDGITLVEKNDLTTQKQDTANRNEHSVVNKNSKGRQKKSLSRLTQQNEFNTFNVHVEPIVTKKSRGRPKKSSTNLEYQSKLDKSQETGGQIATDISNLREKINDEEINDQHDIGANEENQTNENSNANAQAGEKKELNLNVVAKLTSVDKNESRDKTPNVTNVHEQSIVIKKSRGRPKKSSSSFAQEGEPRLSDAYVQPIVVKKSKGRPKKSILGIEPQKELDTSQETELPNDTETSNLYEIINGVESNNERKRNEDQVMCQDEEYSQHSNTDVDNGNNESFHSGVISSVPFNDTSDLDNKRSDTVNSGEQSLLVRKSRGRPRKSSSSFVQQSELESYAAYVQPIVVKKSKGRPKKSLSSIELPNDINTSENVNVSATKEILNPSEQINDDDVETKDRHERNEIDENGILNRQVLSQDETNQHSNINENEEEKESLHSDLVSNVPFSDKSDFDDTLPNNADPNEQSVIAKRSRGRPKKSLSSTNVVFQCEPRLSDEKAQPIVVKKSRGRPKKSLSNIEQSNGGESLREEERHMATTVSDLDEENVSEESQVRSSLSGERDKEDKEDRNTVVVEIHHFDEKSNSSNVHLRAEQNHVNVGLDTTHQSERITEIKEMLRGEFGTLSNSKAQCSTEELHAQDEEEETAVVKKPRGRPKKLNHEQQHESHLSQDKQYEVVKEDKRQGSADHGTGITEEESQMFNSEINNRDVNRTETCNEKVISSGEENEIEQVDNRERENDLILRGNTNNEAKVGSPSSKEQQNCNDVCSDEANSQILQKAAGQEEDDKNNEAPDDENKENKERYSEKDATNEESVSSVTEERDLEKPNDVDGEVTKTSRKYRRFDEINTPVIVDNSKRKRKPKVLLYENEDLDISPARKKKKYLDKSENDVSPEVTTQKVKDKRGLRRGRRPKTLLYKHEDLAMTPTKVYKTKKVTFLLPTKENTADSNNLANVQKDFRATDFAPIEDNKEDNKLEVFTGECDVSTITKKSERIRKPKTLLYENESLRFTPVKDKDIKSEIEKEDLLLLQKFEIKLEPVVVLDRNVDMSFIKKYNPDENSLHITHERRETTDASKPINKTKLAMIAKRPRGRPKTQSLPLNGSKRPKVLAYNYKKIKLNKEKKRRGRKPTKNYSHIITMPGEPPTYKCLICKESFKAISVRAFHLVCAAQTAKTFKCEFCLKNLYSSTHLQYHERMHSGERPFACDLCSKKFVQKSNLNRHILTCHNYTQHLECNECGKKFASKEYLKSHLLSHVESSFVFKCNQCPKSFSLDSSRKRHELSHSRNKHYTCSYCQQQFGRSDNYNRHMLHHHPVELQDEQFSYESTNSGTPETNVDTSSNEEKTQDKKKDKSVIKPKKISRYISNPAPLSISFVQPLTPQSVPSPYSMSQNHELVSVIRETLPDLNNAVPVISAPISVQPSSSLIDPIPLEQALVLNRQIEEKIYTQTSFCEFPGLTRKTNVTIVNHRPNFTYERRNNSKTNSNSNDGTSFLTMNQERTVEQQDDNEINSATKDVHVHWRRRTAEIFKSKVDENE